MRVIAMILSRRIWWLKISLILVYSFDRQVCCACMQNRLKCNMPEKPTCRAGLKSSSITITCLALQARPCAITALCIVVTRKR